MAIREGSLEAPKREPLDWRSGDFYDQDALNTELERVFDICHGCRRCVNLCQAFPTLFDLVDESETLEVDGVDKADYAKVVDQCYLCDLCAETKCPYLPPHEWAVDFPHLMLRAKAAHFKAGKSKWRDRLITSTDPLFDAISHPGIAGLANAAANTPALRKAGQRIIGLHHQAPLPTFTPKPLGKRVDGRSGDGLTPVPCERTTGKVALYPTCYGDHNCPEVVEDLIALLNHNGVPVKVLHNARCCGMPKLELGDLQQVAKQKDANFPLFLEAIDQGYDLMAAIPSCVLMYKQEIPLMFPEGALSRGARGEAPSQGSEAARVRQAFFDPFEYLMLRHKAGLLRTDFQQGLGKVVYQAACHQRVQNMGRKTWEFLNLIPGTEVTAIERCSGHDGTYAVKAATYEKAMKIVRPVVRQLKQTAPERFGSDCPMAGRFIEHALEGEKDAEAQHPISMARTAYGI